MGVKFSFYSWHYTIPSTSTPQDPTIIYIDNSVHSIEHFSKLSTSFRNFVYRNPALNRSFITLFQLLWRKYNLIETLYIASSVRHETNGSWLSTDLPISLALSSTFLVWYDIIKFLSPFPFTFLKRADFLVLAPGIINFIIIFICLK
jgi:hypothetical protein